MMHSELIKSMPDIHLHVVGEGTSRTAIAYLEDLKARFHQGVTYHGYVPESNLDNIFAKVGHVVLPFKPYKYTCSVSGSILGALRRRKIVWTTPVNAIPDLIQDGKNGLYLTMQLQADVGRFLSLLGDRSMSAHLRDGIVKTLSSHSADHIVDTLKGVL
jgi:glycosyltransferase involved in cell wall biosynthesis